MKPIFEITADPAVESPIPHSTQPVVTNAVTIVQHYPNPISVFFLVNFDLFYYLYDFFKNQKHTILFEADDNLISGAKHALQLDHSTFFIMQAYLYRHAFMAVALSTLVCKTSEGRGIGK